MNSAALNIAMEAIRGEQPVAELCRKYDIHQAQFYRLFIFFAGIKCKP
jgi:transposase-like protein